MAAIATGLGYEPTILLTSEATSAAVIDAMSAAAGRLAEGDTFWVTYSGHGGQVRDTNGDEAERDHGEFGETADTTDETWCLYDRQLIDDELWALWARFPAGGRILVLSDSCHSGTVTRELPDWDEVLAQGGGPLPRNRAMPRAVALRIMEQQGRAVRRYREAGPAPGEQPGAGDRRPGLRVHG